MAFLFLLPLFIVSLYREKLFMKKLFLWCLWMIGGLMTSASFFACGGEGKMRNYLHADSLNRVSYEWRYKDLNLSDSCASEALRIGRNHPSVKAEALNHLAFCAFIRMDFQKADSLFKEVYSETANELECLVADVGMMKICQRTAMNKEFYDYRNSALRRMKRIGEDEDALTDEHILRRFNYARSEFSITSSVYYYYLQQEAQSLAAIDEIDVEDELQDDTAQLLCYYYMKGSGGMYKADTPEDIVVGEFDYLMDCLMLSHEKGYIYFEANASQAMAELLKNQKNYQLLLERRLGMMRIANHSDLPWEELVVAFAENALKLFKEYGDWYQISGTLRTLASCQNELGHHVEALAHLTEALSYVNLHHEKYYHCQDTLDRLKPYVPMATTSTELKWINAEGIMTVPEWIARFREQLSVTYAALGMKPQSDYNRNIYLDILDYTRQDKELESRYLALEEETSMLNGLLVLVVGGFVFMSFLLAYLSKRWRVRNALYVNKLKMTLGICRRITASVPSDATEMEDVIDAIMKAVKHQMMELTGATDMEIIPVDAESMSSSSSEDSVFLLKDSEGRSLAVWNIRLPEALSKEDKALIEVIVPYLSWTLENGLALISLGDERRRLEKEQYVHEQHLVENKRQNLVKKACLFIVTGITPYIDRVVNEVHKLTAFNYLSNPSIKEGKFRYIDELVSRINEYNEILSLWIKMRQGSLSLNIETFELNTLFEVLQKGRKNFEAKGQTFEVEPTDVCVKADKALTLFMVNTLTENARKYTQQGGNVKVYATEEQDYVEISVEDNGPGLSKDDVDCILNEKIYDSGKIGVQTSQDSETLMKNKGSGFGLMNCRGIIEKYRKTNSLFRVCVFQVESSVGKGSRFFFRLPKGVRKVWFLCLLMLMPGLWGCGSDADSSVEIAGDSLFVSEILDDTLVHEANRLANRVYDANLEGRYTDAVVCADSALTLLNEHFLKHADFVAPLLQLVGEGASAELEWFEEGFDTDYYALLDVRNELAVAYLAMNELDAYRFNNQAYVSLYKQISVDNSLEEYCKRMRLSANNKIVAIMLCVALLVFLLAGYYFLYLRHRLRHRYGLEQVIEINRKALSAPAYQQGEVKDFVDGLMGSLFKELNELVALEEMGIAVYSDETQDLCFAFSDVVDEEELKTEMKHCFESNEQRWIPEKKLWCFPLRVEVADESRCMGVMALNCAMPTGREDDRLMLELVAGYVSIIVYNAMELVAQKYRDIEVAQDEARRVMREESQLHVQNMVLDNCLSTIKHETLYYPSRIKQILERLHEGLSEEEEKRQVETMGELVGYYKDVFTILSSCAARQLEEVTFRRGVVKSKDLADSAMKYFKRVTRKLDYHLELKMEVEPLLMTGDVVMLKYLLENLLSEAVSYASEGVLEIRAYKEGAFVRFDFVDRRRTFSQEELNLLFYPHLSQMQNGQEGVLAGTEYLVCKQIIRDHDEFAGRRGCRINANVVADGGFMVWFTIPAR